MNRCPECNNDDEQPECPECGRGTDRPLTVEEAVEVIVKGLWAGSPWSEETAREKVLALIAAAKAEQREEDARIAETHFVTHPVGLNHATSIAAAIRGGKP